MPGPNTLNQSPGTAPEAAAPGPAPTPQRTLRILSGGAAQGLCEALAPGFEAAHGCRIAAAFGAVGGMRDRLVAREACDVVILTQALIDTLSTSGHTVAGTAAAVGTVATGVAVAERDGVAHADDPNPASADSLRAALLAATTLHCPDTEKSTAGQHVLRMLNAMGIADVLAPRIARYPGGNLAMAELARRGRSGGAVGELGITQVTEIRYTAGVRLVGLLPPPYALDTAYVAAVAQRSTHVALAQAWIAELTGARHANVRARCGFA